MTPLTARGDASQSGTATTVPLAGPRTAMTICELLAVVKICCFRPNGERCHCTFIPTGSNFELVLVHLSPLDCCCQGAVIHNGAMKERGRSMVRRLLHRHPGFAGMSGKGELWLMVVIAVLIVLSFIGMSMFAPR